MKNYWLGKKKKCDNEITCSQQDGYKCWSLNDGRLHREDGPAVEISGKKDWYLNGVWQKTEYYNKDGLLHRENGPAIVWDDGGKAWYVNGQLILYLAAG